MFFDDVAYAMGSMGQQGAAGGEAFGSPLSMNILLMVVIFAIFYFLIIRPQHKEAKRLKAMLSALKRGDRVITVGGIYGIIVEVKDEIVLLDLGDSTIEVGRKYISAVAEGKPAVATKNTDRKRRPAPRKSAAKAGMEEGSDKDTEFATDMVESDEPVKDEPQNDGNESKDEQEEKK